MENCEQRGCRGQRAAGACPQRDYFGSQVSIFQDASSWRKLNTQRAMHAGSADAFLLIQSRTPREGLPLLWRDTVTTASPIKETFEGDSLTVQRVSPV